MLAATPPRKPDNAVVNLLDQLLLRQNHELLTEVQAYGVYAGPSQAHFSPARWPLTTSGTGTVPGYVDAVVQPIVAMVASGDMAQARVVMKNLAEVHFMVERALSGPTPSYAMDIDAVQKQIAWPALGPDGQRIVSSALYLATQGLEQVRAQLGNIQGLTFKDTKGFYESALTLSAMPELRQYSRIQDISMRLSGELDRQSRPRIGWTPQPIDTDLRGLNSSAVIPEYVRRFNALHGPTDRYRIGGESHLDRIQTGTVSTGRATHV